MNIILIGPPGAGKGTIAQALQKEFSLPQISTGDLIRAEIKAQTELGKKVMEFVNNGKLAPDNLIIELTQNRLKQKDCKEGFILDGFPRTLNQARAITTANVQIDYVLNLKVSKETILKRLSNRRQCKHCGNVFNILTKQPKKKGVCDKCGGELYQREDDKPETIKQRINVYIKETKPVINYYKEKGLLLNVNADTTIDGLVEAARKLLGK